MSKWYSCHRVALGFETQNQIPDFEGEGVEGGGVVLIDGQNNGVDVVGNGIVSDGELAELRNLSSVPTPRHGSLATRLIAVGCTRLCLPSASCRRGQANGEGVIIKLLRAEANCAARPFWLWRLVGSGSAEILAPPSFRLLWSVTRSATPTSTTIALIAATTHGISVSSNSLKILTLFGDARLETFRSLTAFYALSLDTQNTSPDNRLPARVVIHAKLACVFAVAMQHQILEDRELLLRVIEERAVLEILEDNFLSVWTGVDVPPPWAGQGCWGDESDAAWGGEWTMGGVVEKL
ncbi:hypothetical protein R3P38DRAFT_2803443 [Favolaschia claudopus]|uniref:Uncharacterized protein n=1 Tax=Favolaschia claudopus TaxID=2862362 RepID=A0AAV9ZTJ2_9AGAR